MCVCVCAKSIKFSNAQQVVP